MVVPFLYEKIDLFHFYNLIRLISQGRKVLFEHKSMVFKIFQVVKLAAVFVILQSKSKFFHFGKKVIIDNTPLPDIMNISPYAVVLGVYLVHFFEYFLVQWIVFCAWNVLKEFFIAKIKKPDSLVGCNELLIVYNKTFRGRSIHP